MDHPAWDVVQPLLSFGHQRDQQCSTTVVEIHRPRHHTSTREAEGVVDQIAEFGFVVGDAMRKQSRSLAVDHHTVVVRFACIDSCP